VKWVQGAVPVAPVPVAKADIPAIVKELYLHPGQWAEVAQYASAGTARGHRTRYRRRYPDISWRTKGDTVFACYQPTATDAAPGKDDRGTTA
jgi:hypothetical protein